LISVVQLSRIQGVKPLAPLEHLHEMKASRSAVSDHLIPLYSEDPSFLFNIINAKNKIIFFKADVWTAGSVAEES
jgi:hypothetical protein